MSQKKVMILTGASDGIGLAAARALAGQYDLVLLGRSPEKTKKIATELNRPYYLVDYADLTQVRKVAKQLLERYPEIHVLANNAGAVMGQREVTKDGFEKTFQVNHLAPFLLTSILMPALLKGRAKVIHTASASALRFGKHFDMADLQSEKDYHPERAYGNAKLGTLLFMRELDKRYGKQGIVSVAFHPGLVGTNFASDTTHIMRHFHHGPLKHLFTISPEKGAEQLIWLATAEAGKDFQAGAYYEKGKIAQKVNPLMYDERLMAQLWEKSEEFLKIN